MINQGGLVQVFGNVMLDAKLDSFVILKCDFRMQRYLVVFDDQDTFNTSFVMWLKCWFMVFEIGLENGELCYVMKYGTLVNLVFW